MEKNGNKIPVGLMTQEREQVSEKVLDVVHDFSLLVLGGFLYSLAEAKTTLLLILQTVGRARERKTFR